MTLHAEVSKVLSKIRRREASRRPVKTAVRNKEIAARKPVQPNTRALLHSKNPLDRFQGVLDDVFNVGTVMAVDPRRAIKESTNKGDIYHTLYVAVLPPQLSYEQLADLVDAFERHNAGMTIRNLSTSIENDTAVLSLTVVTN